MELPVYHLPTLRGMFIHTWHRTWMYIKKAGTVILGINIIFWLTMYFPRQDTKQYDNERLRAKNGFTANLRSSGIDGITLSNDGTLAASSLERLKAEGKDNIIKNYNSYMEKLKEAVKKQNASQLSYSIAGRVGRSLEGVTRYAGFDWKINIALIGGFAAKELVLGTMGTVYSMGDVDPEQPDALSARLARSEEWNPLKAFVLMIFVMVYAPCLPTVAAIKKETGSWFWPVFAVIYSMVFGLVIALIAFQVGKLLLL
jgi:ferrous iron transport protein B